MAVQRRNTALQRRDIMARLQWKRAAQERQKRAEPRKLFMFIRIRANVKRPVRLWTNGMTQRSTDILVRQNGKTVPVPGRTGQPARLAVRKMKLRLPHIGSR